MTQLQGIDQEALQEAQRALGTQNPTDTVNAALRQVARTRVIAAMLDEYAARDASELDRLRDNAWR